MQVVLEPTVCNASSDGAEKNIHMRERGSKCDTKKVNIWGIWVNGILEFFIITL